jgi:type I restriction enzyme S subunit
LKYLFEMQEPKLRFPGFLGRWASKKFGELYSFRSTNSLSRDNLNYELGIVKNIHYGDIHTKFESHFDILKEKVPFVNPDVNLSRISQDNYLREGDLVIADASEDYNDIGKTIEVINLNNESVLAGLHTFLARKESNEIFLGFPTFLLKSRKVRLDIMKIAQGTKVLSLSSNRLGNIFLDFPSLPEQTKIASFLATVDEKIQHLKKQLSLQEQYKKGVMQKIFSREIRFKDENGKDFPEWEEKKLGEVINQKNNRNKENIELKVLSVSNSRGFILQSDQFEGHRVASIDTSNYKIVSKGDVAYNPSRINVGSIAILKNHQVGIVSPMYTVFSLNFKLITSRFFESIINTHKFSQLVKQSCSGSVRDSLHFDNLSEFQFQFPSIQEQQKIASFLSSIDDKIEKNKEQIHKIELWKKGLLQQMFI